MTFGYNPDFNPTGIEGGIDTNVLPWLALPQAPQLALKPLRASTETGMFSAMARIEAGNGPGTLVHLGAMDLMILSGTLEYADGPLAGIHAAGTWGYVPANARVTGLRATETAELLINCYGPLAFLDENGRIASVLTSLDLIAMARHRGITLVPNTLAECMQPRLPAYEGRGAPLGITGRDGAALVASVNAAADSVPVHPHFVDTRNVPWYVSPKTPDFGLKILRVSEETGVTSMIVRHNGVAPPHYHLASADFLILSGHIGYRQGPPEGYGPGVWFFEPAGARHDATQRLGDDDLIYTANVYGPLQFDRGRGTPISAVMSWMQYREIAKAAGSPMVANRFDDDASLLAWTPLHGVD